jgi:hypothetical protein
MGSGRLNEQDPVGIGAVSKTAPLESAVFSWPLQREELLATATDFIEMSEQVGGIFVNPGGARALKLLLSEAAGQ